MVEHLGSGVPRILRTYSEDSFIFLDNFIRVVFKSEKSLNEKQETVSIEKLGEKLGEKLTKNQKSIIDIILNNPYSTINKISQKIGISSTAVENNLRKLKEKRYIERVGSDKGGYWKIIKEKLYKKEK